MSQLGGSENGPSGDIMGLTTLCKLKAIEHAAGCRQRMHKTHTQLTHTHTHTHIYTYTYTMTLIALLSR
jgi:hypothetical protein